MKYEGRVWKFGDHVDTDLILPARYLNISRIEELAKNCFADLRADFTRKAKQGDIVVAGENFGCGSSREHAPLALKGVGISIIIAKSFARIFYRNAINIGLPLLESIEAAENLMEEGQASVNLATGEINDLLSDQVFFAKPIPDFMMKIITAGGVVPYIKKKGS